MGKAGKDIPSLGYLQPAHIHPLHNHPPEVGQHHKIGPVPRGDGPEVPEPIEARGVDRG